MTDSTTPTTTTMPYARAVVDEAIKVIGGDRREAYGDVSQSFVYIAAAWSGILNYCVTPRQVALCMIALKLQREANAHKHDNLVDIVGYTGLLAELEG